MSTTIGYCQVKDLPDSLRSALRSVGYAKADISVSAAEMVSISDAGSAGRRAFAVLVDIATGETRTTRGSWGGSNMFNPHNAVDLDDRQHTLPPGGAVVRGSEGGTVYATITVHPSNVAKWLPSGRSDVTDRDRSLLNAMRLKAGTYRQDELRRIRATPEEIDSLVERGLCSRNKAGAISVTTAGRNAQGSVL